MAAVRRGENDASGFEEDPRERRAVGAFQSRLATQAQEIPTDGNDGNDAIVFDVRSGKVALGERAARLDAIPGGRVSDVRKRHVVVLAPEKRRVRERPPAAEHAASRRLPLPL